MNERLIIGQYYPANSVLHRLDPRVKFIGSFAYITMIFFAESLLSWFFAAVYLFAMVIISKVPVRLMLKGLKSILFILIFTCILNIFFAPGETVVFEFYFIKITLEGLLLFAKMAARLVLLIISSSILTLTTTPLALTDALEFFLRPFAKIGLPAQEIAMMMTIALRFIPTLMEETEKIMKAQKARGADFETGGLVRRAKALVPILVPLFISSFKRAEDLAMAMEARCYRTDIKRSKMKELKFQRADYSALVCVTGFIAGLIIFRYF
ncbi:MAG: energy-coupling factor transporter transmembrane protein EcfT [Clostridiales bacterium]|jgi:energy-coupling factor transport system permease protein|nr:energy-coupling factor transporter transmembrane protein EcfT [Clostridiales bacterium]